MNDQSGNYQSVLIVGAGVAGLSCAVTLHRAGIPITLLDRDQSVGGRIQTDEVDGFRLDCLLYTSDAADE